MMVNVFPAPFQLFVLVSSLILCLDGMKTKFRNTVHVTWRRFVYLGLQIPSSPMGEL